MTARTRTPNAVDLAELRAILQERTRSKAVQRAVEVIARLVPSSSVTLMRVDPRGHARFEAWVGLERGLVRAAERSFDREGLPPNLLEVMRTRRAVVVGDVPTYAEWRTPAPEPGSWAGFPILLHGRVIAILNVQTRGQRITPDVVAAIRPVVDTVGLLILRYEEARELVARNQQIDILYAMATAGAEQLDDQALRGRVGQILGRIAHSHAYEHALVFIYDPHQEALVLRAGRGEGSEHVGMALSVQEGKGVVVHAYSSCRPVLVRDTRRRRASVSAPWPVRSELAMPLVVGGHCVGVLDVESRKPDAFTRLDIRVLRPYASGLALLIDNQQKTRLLHDQAMRDPLTGFFNRRMMDQVVPREVERARRYHRDLSLVMLDIDAFKAINDQEGHEAGDHVLRVFSQCIRQVVRASDFVYRYGGDEFLILLPETSSSEAREMLARLTATGCPELTTSLGRVTFSAGIASYALDAVAEDLVKVADDRLYQSKRLGKGRITVR